MKLFKKLVGAFSVSLYVKALIAGTIMALFGYFVTANPLGLGVDQIESMISGTRAAWYDPILKTIFTSITLNAGGSGGVITPIFYLGASSGSLFGQVFHLDPATFAAIGMVALLAGAANTPVAASVMSIELFGPEIAPYAAVACVISFLMTGHRSIYPSQVLGMTKSFSIKANVGREIAEVETVADPDDTTLLKYLKPGRRGKRRK